MNDVLCTCGKPGTIRIGSMTVVGRHANGADRMAWQLDYAFCLTCLAAAAAQPDADERVVRNARIFCRNVPTCTACGAIILMQGGSAHYCHPHGMVAVVWNSKQVDLVESYDEADQIIKCAEWNAQYDMERAEQQAAEARDDAARADIVSGSILRQMQAHDERVRNQAA